MNRYQPSLPSLFFLTLLAIFSSAPAKVKAASAPIQRDTSSWLEELKADAEKKGISDQTIEHAMTQIQLDEKTIASKPTKTIGNALSPERIALGRKILDENSALLAQISNEYGVQPRFLVAIWGVSTQYGASTDKTPTLNTLANLAYQDNHSDYFKNELVNAIKILDEGRISSTELTGNEDGQLGQARLSPSLFRQYGVDQNHDGRVDIWNTPADILASTANTLKQMGWIPGQYWGREVRLPEKFNRKLLGMNRQVILKKWQELGVRLVNGEDLPTGNIHGSLMQPDPKSNRVFLVYNNYYSLLRWERSAEFAINVGLLADMLVDPSMDNTVPAPFASVGD